MTLPEIWGLLITMIIVIYVCLDGFDLGIGMLLPLNTCTRERSLMLSSIIPIWDGNQTWLVLGAACLYGAFPEAFAVILPLIYLPMLGMVICLLMRGISLEFRMKSLHRRLVWERVFFLSSCLTTALQGYILGVYTRGFNVETIWSKSLFFHAIPWISAVGLVAGYGLLGSCWLIMKAQSTLLEKAYRWANYGFMVTGSLLALFCLCVINLSPHHQNQWFESIAIIICPLLCLFFLGLGLVSTTKKTKIWPMLSSVGLFLVATVGILISVYPYIVPHSLTLADTAAPTSSLRLMLIGFGIFFPPLVIYTLYAHWVFRGKIDELLEY